ncbi:hypothetical protein L873DRAFT_1744754 [Choiromyces venosus 120613-1]|uniref:mannan endo-1,4-beta-mannosidase n=1 Tax=Choiromyces venosus 120613-1 TaxID=1336337 RepID=A0A3N4JBZ2_9PEZI|nr:hypothetical protein L873DRAFT_1744754 [Choiromyces venosus 120613-1]
MKLSIGMLAALAATSLQGFAAANNFAGMSSYFLHAYKQPDRIAVLDAVKAAGGKVLRIFISYTAENAKGSGSVRMPDIEPVTVGVWDDTQLLAIDQMMVEAQTRGIKLIIALHDRYALGCWSSDAYVKKYKLPAIDCNSSPASANNVVSWYQDPSPIYDFDNRMKHIVNHRNPLLGNKKWSELSSYIFSFNIQNEGQGHLNGNVAPVPGWWCDRARQIRNEMGTRSGILISTGGGNEFANSDVGENWDCPQIDLVDIHSYYGAQEFKNKLLAVMSKAKVARKLVMVEEFGGTGSDKVQILKDHINYFNSVQIPWAVWQISKPGRGTADYEFWTDEESYGVVTDGVKTANGLGGWQNWPNLPSTLIRD